MKKHTIFGFIIAIMLSASACGPSRVVVADKPNPPAYTRPNQPGPDYVWVDGDWYVSGGKYQWKEGHWDRPRSGHTWVPGHWVATKGGYYWVRGHWR